MDDNEYGWSQKFQYYNNLLAAAEERKVNVRLDSSLSQTSWNLDRLWQSEILKLSHFSESSCKSANYFKEMRMD